MSCSLSAPDLPAPYLRSGAASTPILLSVRHFYLPCRSFRSGALRHFRTCENGRGSQDVLPPGGTGIPGRKIHLQYFSLFCFIMPNRYPIIKRVFIFFQSKHGKNRVKIYMYTKKTGGIRCSPAFIFCFYLSGHLSQALSDRSICRICPEPLSEPLSEARSIVLNRSPCSKPGPEPCLSGCRFSAPSQGSRIAATPTRPGPVLRASVAAICLR